MQTIMLIYAIVAVIVWVAVNLFFWKISLDLEKEVRDIPEEKQETRQVQNGG